MIPKYTPFKKVFNYKTDMDIHIWQSVLSNKSYRFKFLKEMHKNHHLYTYCISSRTGVIRIDLKKRGDILKLQIREGVFGFFLPFLFLLMTVFSLIQQVCDVAGLMFFGSCLFMTIIYLSNRYYSDEIRKIIEKELRNQNNNNSA